MNPAPGRGERREPRGHGDRIAGERARLVDRPQRRDLLHDRAPAAERAHRHAAADHLAQRRQVRRDAVQALHAARVDAKARHHLVEDQHHAVTVAQRAQPGQEPRPRNDQVHVAGDRLDDHAGDVVALHAEGRLDGVEVVVGQHQRLVGDRRRHAGRRRLPEGERSRAGLHQQAVAVPVVAALELDDLAAPREPARKAQRRHRRLGARRHEPDQLERRQPADQRLGHLDLDLGGSAERQARVRLRPPRARRPGARARGSPAPRIRRNRCSGHRRHPTIGAFAALEETRRAPTERKARTGELTPAGMLRWARAKSSSLRLMIEGSGSDIGAARTPPARGAARASGAGATARCARRGAQLGKIRFYVTRAVPNEKVHVPDLRLDLRRGRRSAGRRHSAGHPMGGRAPQLDLSGVRRAQGDFELAEF